MIGDTALDIFNRAKALFEHDDFILATKEVLRLNDLNFSYVKKSGHDALSSKIAIAVVAHKPLLATRSLIQRLSALTEDPDYHFILVSNATADLFSYAGDMIPGRFLSLIMGGNFGASLGRNAAIHHADAEAIVFIDDDGLTDCDSIKRLVATYETYDAAAIRGKVVPLTGDAEVPPHYDMGKFITQRFMDIEGMTLWKMAAVRKEGFDPLLYGHEGIELTGRLYRRYGRDGFLYEPNAVLHHDFATTEDAASAKRIRMERNSRYLDFKQPGLTRLKSVFYRMKSDTHASTLLGFRRTFVATKSQGNGKATFITTCLNGGEFIEDYYNSLAAQTISDFKVIFVDDGSVDGSLDRLEELTRGDDRFKLLKANHVGRAAALNIAVSHADTEIALIADVDDVSVPQRAEWTLRAHALWPDSDVIGFNIFDDGSAVRATRPHIIRPVPIAARRYFGMPCPFPGISFRPTSMKAAFNENLAAGIDCDWLHRNFELHQLKGWYLPLSVTYYRTHSGQITASKRELQREKSLECLQAVHRKILGTLDEDDIIKLELFAGWRPMNSGIDWSRMKSYADNLIAKANEFDPNYAQILSEEIARHLDERHLTLSKNDYSKAKDRLKTLSDQSSSARKSLRDAENAQYKLKQKIEKTSKKLAWNRSKVSKLQTVVAATKQKVRRREIWLAASAGCAFATSAFAIIPELF